MNRKQTLSQIPICLVVVSAISGSPAKATPLAAAESAADDENSEIYITSNQPRKTALPTEDSYIESYSTLNQHLQRDQGKEVNLGIQNPDSPVDNLLIPPKESKLDAITPNRPMSRVKRRLVHRPLFVYRHFHQRNSVKKPVRGRDVDDDDDDGEEVPQAKKRTGHEFAHKKNRTQTDAFRYDSDEYQRFYNDYIAGYKKYSPNGVSHIYGRNNQFVSPSSFYYDV